MSTALLDIGTLIESIPGVYGGRPRLARSGFPIIQLVADYQAGMRAYPHIDEESLLRASLFTSRTGRRSMRNSLNGTPWGSGCKLNGWLSAD